jgi:hypothetical protein
MNTLTRIVQRVIGGLVLLTLGMVAGQVMAPSPVLGSSPCPLQMCFVGASGYSCHPTVNEWSCDMDTGGCITNECTDPPNPCYPLVCMEGGSQG